ncbi:DUF1766-domain-containing protein [Durotheca rogersii]|uniref:DUF1766-domain-containing protein n=1 Tax=Durotheca rogersii TaxID=419775 RepID=UPI00221E8AD3|nr:DUF1766-domain-containing protein [Durotheca rogersii]KAI5865359.1 DUF1766-domain-containing protein [Durotheca rogersii]
MPFIPNTPESHLGRSDSKNPETTCRGITSGGRPCRRPLDAPPKGSRIKGKNARVDDLRDPDLYCWQHKDQANLSAQSSPGPRTKITPILESRPSVDTLIGRLGIVEAQQGGHSAGGNRHDEKYSQPQQYSETKKRTTFCCCFTLPDVEEELPTRPQPTPIQSAPQRPASSKLPSSQQHLAPPSAHSRPASSSSKRPSEKSTTSQTSQYLTLIPPTASPQTASQLMAELAKPISQQDEPGYIYIFWLTPESQPAGPPAEAARSLLSPPRPDARQRRPSDVLQSFAVKNSKTSSSSKKTILLKIGRATNVQRRLNEWTRQCGYNLSLIRYYPYIPSSNPTTPRKMPHSHKVERLVHLELIGAGLRVSDKAVCEACGKSHREWFEVDANRESVVMVDEIVKRWSDWDESRA